MRIKIEEIKEGHNPVNFPAEDIIGGKMHGYKITGSDDLDLDAERSGLYIHITGSHSVEFEALCDRCAESYKTTQFIKIDYMFHIGKLRTDTEDIIDIDPSENEGYLDLSNYYAEAFFISQPMKHLCSDDCKGLCQRCGANLNNGSCGCKSERSIDPRWNKLQDILDKNN
ncbi:MAG: DUF177 domain-containing protein [Candidatus Delongbacteria bacterium]